jgi:hypothetical protein
LGYKCALCGGAPGFRSERCYVSEETKAKLLANAQNLKAFGVTLEEHRSLQKGIGGLEVFGIVLAVADSLDSGVLRKLVLYLRDIAVPKEDILRLRLDEPEQIAEALSIKDTNDHP